MAEQEPQNDPGERATPATVEAPPDAAREKWEPHLPPTPLEGDAGTSAGINIEPGSNDDGWRVPPPVVLGDGTRVQLYKDGEALHAGFDAIKEARRRVCMEMYIFRSDETGRAFADLLAAKAREGVQVYLIYDSLGCADSDDEIFDTMRSAGVRMAEFHPVRPWDCKYSWRPFNRDHRKLVIIDDDRAGLGGLNVGGEYAGSWIVQQRHRAPWRDNAVGIVGPGSRHLLNAFVRTWRYIHQGGRITKSEYMHNVDDGEFGVLGSVPTRHSPLAPLNRMLADAKESIHMTMSYFAPPDDLIDVLCKVARRRKNKVRVRLMLPAECDVPILLTAARSFYEKLLAAGCEVYERQGAILHAKTLVIDGHTTVLGSTNLDFRSLEYNLELSIIVRNTQFGHQVEDLFENDVRYAKRITNGEWRRRPTWDRVVQWAVRRARYLL